MDYSEKPPPPQRPRDRADDEEEEPDYRRSGGEPPQGLGSLAQSARNKKLNLARGILFFVGILTIAVNIWMLFQIQKEVNEARQRGMIIIQSRVNLFYAATYVGIALGVVFTIFGFLVKVFPVPITITSLVLYVAAYLGFGALEPENLWKGAVIKVLIVVGLIQSIQAAIAYQKEEKRTARIREEWPE